MGDCKIDGRGWSGDGTLTLGTSLVSFRLALNDRAAG